MHKLLTVYIIYVNIHSIHKLYIIKHNIHASESSKLMFIFVLLIYHLSLKQIFAKCNSDCISLTKEPRPERPHLACTPDPLKSALLFPAKH